MALDPAVLKARIDLRVAQLKQLAAWTTVNWRGRAEREQQPRGLPPPPARRNEDDEGQTGDGRASDRYHRDGDDQRRGEDFRKRIAFPRFGSVSIVDPLSGETLRLETVMRQ